MARKFLVFLFLLASCTALIACGNGAATSFDIAPATENFGQKIVYNNKVDILLIVDNSSSMQQHQTRLASQMSSLVGALQSLKMDYHIAVITTSMGAGGDGGQFVGEPKFLTGASSHLETELSNRILRGQSGSNNERGLSSMETALSPSYLSTEGKGYLRSEALLSVIILTDEDDKSLSSVSYYAGFLDQLKPAFSDGKRSWVFNFIGVKDNSGSCKTFNEYSEVGVALMQLADISGGLKESICSTNLGYAISNIKARIVQILTDFYLSRQPSEETIVVAVNGVVVQKNTTNGWSYVEEGGKYIIRFNGDAVPPADADIRIDFKPMNPM